MNWKSHLALLRRWKERLRAEPGRGFFFFEDGAVNSSLYEQSPRRLVFVLKEGNHKAGAEGDSYDLTDFVRTENACSATWDNLARWAVGITSRSLLSWEQLPVVTDQNRGALLGATAFLNLNKRGGGSITNMSELRRAVLPYANEIRTQLELLEPDLVVACGTGVLLRELVAGTPWVEGPSSGRVHTWHFTAESPSVPVVASPHPQARRRHSDMYEAVVAAGRALMRKRWFR